MAERYVLKGKSWYDTLYQRTVPQTQIDAEKKRFATPSVPTAMKNVKQKYMRGK